MDCLMSPPFMIGRYWIDHDIDISLIGLIVHIFTSLILLLSSYALIYLLLPYRISVVLIIFSTTSCILYSFCSKLIVLILFTMIYQYLMAFCGYYVVIINDNKESLLNKIIFVATIIIIVFAIQILFCHKYCMGSLPKSIGPKWFPPYIDVLLKQFNEPYLILMVFTFHYKLFGVDCTKIELAKYYKTLYSKGK